MTKARRRLIYFGLLLIAIVLAVVAWPLMKGIDGQPDTTYHKMFRACSHGDLAQVQRLIRDGADPNGISDYQAQPVFEFTSPLFLAVSGRHIEIVNFLVESGADPDQIEGPNRTPFMEAVEIGDPSMVSIILEANADLDYSNDPDDTALAHASRRGHSEIVSILKAHSAQPPGTKQR